jgi:hypothetical protein
MKKLSAAKIALHRETIRSLNAEQLQGIQGAGSIYTKIPTCSTDGFVCQTNATCDTECSPTYTYTKNNLC